MWRSQSLTGNGGLEGGLGRECFDVPLEFVGVA